MNFFTIQWWNGLQTGNSGEAVDAYAGHLKQIWRQLTPELRLLNESLSLHDAKLLAIEISLPEKLGVLKLKLDTKNHLELHYLGLTGFETHQSPKDGFHGEVGFGDLGYDEIDVLPDGSFEHRLLFSTSIELKFRFLKLELQPS